MNVAVMGATSHIAKGLIDSFFQERNDYLFLFTRSAEKVKEFLFLIGVSSHENYTICDDYLKFNSFDYDVIINCVGVETRNKQNCDYTRYFSVTEEFDNLALNYLKNVNSGALYISFSSGAVYGRGFSSPADDNSTNSVRVNQVECEDYYGIARLNAEAKHRAHAHLRIIDLRIFSYFSRYINLSDGYFMTDVLQAILENRELITGESNFVRDYLHPEDLFSVITKCMSAGKINQAIDISSSCPVSKNEILDFFSTHYNLKYSKQASLEKSSATGTKNNYFSTCKSASLIGYTPMYRSLDTLKQESELILFKKQITGVLRNDC